VWRLHRDSALLSCGTCLQGLESISLEVGSGTVINKDAVTMCPRSRYPRTFILGRRVPWTMCPLSCGTCLQGSEPISLEVGNNQQGRRNDVSLTEVSPNVYPWTTRPVTDVSYGRSDHTATKIPFMYSVSGNARPQSKFHIHVSVSGLYIPLIDRPHIYCSRIGRSTVEIYKSPTDT